VGKEGKRGDSTRGRVEKKGKEGITEYEPRAFDCRKP